MKYCSSQGMREALYFKNVSFQRFQSSVLHGAKLDSEADVSKCGQIRLHIRLGPDIAGYENMAGFRPGPDVISGATLLPSQSIGYGSDK